MMSKPSVVKGKEKEQSKGQGKEVLSKSSHKIQGDGERGGSSKCPEVLYAICLYKYMYTCMNVYT